MRVDDRRFLDLFGRFRCSMSLYDVLGQRALVFERLRAAFAGELDALVVDSNVRLQVAFVRVRSTAVLVAAGQTLAAVDLQVPGQRVALVELPLTDGALVLLLVLGGHVLLQFGPFAGHKGAALTNAPVTGVHFRVLTQSGGTRIRLLALVTVKRFLWGDRC